MSSGPSVLSRNIKEVRMSNSAHDGHTLYAPEEDVVGFDGVTKIHITERCGPASYVPYVQVFKGESLYAEYPLHNVVRVVYFQESPQ